MTVYIAMQAPTAWPFRTPVVPASLMPSGNAYRPDASGQIQANQADVGALAGYGFALPGSKLPSITDTGTLVTIAADAKITGSLDIAEHLHFHESSDPGTPSVGGVIFADTSDHKLKYTFHDGTTTALAPASGGGSSGLVLISSGTITAPVEFLDITLPVGYVKFSLFFYGVLFSVTDGLAGAFSVDGGSTFLNDTNNFDTYWHSEITINPQLTGGLAATNNSNAVLNLSGNQGSAAGFRAKYSLMIDPGASNDLASVEESNAYEYDGTRYIKTIGSNAINLNATLPPSPGRVNLLRLIPIGNDDVNPPTSGETFTAGAWFLLGVPTP